jgi:hypothetical protein
VQRFAAGVSVRQIWLSGHSAFAPAHVQRPVVAAGADEQLVVTETLSQVRPAAHR